jgi:3-dehydroquinate dehydratase
MKAPTNFKKALEVIQELQTELNQALVKIDKFNTTSVAVQDALTKRKTLTLDEYREIVAQASQEWQAKQKINPAPRKRA